MRRVVPELDRESVVRLWLHRQGLATPRGSLALSRRTFREHLERTGALQLLWHDGRVAIRTRRHFRRVYDLAERVYPDGPTATTVEYHDSWLFSGLSGNGVANERHLTDYFTGPKLTAAERERVIARNLKKKRIVEVRVEGQRGPFYALPEHLELLDQLEPPRART